jgi:hypothetical protein
MRGRYALLLLVILAGCGARPILAGGMPGVSIPIHDEHSLANLCTIACNRKSLLGCGCDPKAKCQDTPEVLWCVAKAKSCSEVEACSP